MDSSLSMPIGVGNVDFSPPKTHNDKKGVQSIRITNCVRNLFISINRQVFSLTFHRRFRNSEFPLPISQSPTLIGNTIASSL
jgi:hypothetical protein